MSPNLALSIYLATLAYVTYRLASKKPISHWDYLGASLSYAFFGFAWVLEKFMQQ